ncbi:MAG: hypothetical protein JSV80_09690 [Acidobacteriota bacterium]|nr:MAG: hypothetical protein JSV80_09690 [Acidobacteriota bacterium]
MNPNRNLAAALLIATAAMAAMLWLGVPNPAKRAVELAVFRELVLPFHALSPEAQAQEIAALVALQERTSEELFRSPDVLATGVGLTPRGRLALHIYTEGGAVPSLPAVLGGVPVVITPAEPFVALQELATSDELRADTPEDERRDQAEQDGEINRRSRFERPVPIGVSTGHTASTAGTIGALVTDGSSSYALSDHHVFAAGGAAQIGDLLLQPGPFDGGIAPTDAIGTLAALEPIDYSLFANNRVDAALALTDDVDYRTPEDGYGAPRTTPVTAVPGMKIKKYGRTTGLTRGTVQTINATVNVRYKNDVARFVGQVIACCSVSAGGDSGSLIVVDDVDDDGEQGSDDRRPVGLLFAGNGNFTIANPIEEVLDRFDVRIVGDDSN